MPTLHALRLFVATADTGSFSAAGRRHGVAPSSVSRQVASLEDGLGRPAAGPHHPAREPHRGRPPLLPAHRLGAGRPGRSDGRGDGPRGGSPRGAPRQWSACLRGPAHRPGPARIPRPVPGGPGRPHPDRQFRGPDRGRRRRRHPRGRTRGFQPDRPPAGAQPPHPLREPRLRVGGRGAGRPHGAVQPQLPCLHPPSRRRALAPRGAGGGRARFASAAISGPTTPRPCGRRRAAGSASRCCRPGWSATRCSRAASSGSSRTTGRPPGRSTRQSTRSTPPTGISRPRFGRSWISWSRASAPRRIGRRRTAARRLPAATGRETPTGTSRMADRYGG